MTNYKTDPKYVLPSPEWFYRQFGIQWDGQYTTLGSNTAQVVKIQRMDPDETLVIRISDPSRISQDRISQIHRFQTYLKTQGVFTALPYETPQGETFSTTESGFTIEVYPFIHGKSPQRGDFEDVRLVARVLPDCTMLGWTIWTYRAKKASFRIMLLLNNCARMSVRRRNCPRGRYSTTCIWNTRRKQSAG